MARCLAYIIYIMLDGGKDRFYVTIFTFLLEGLVSIILISIYIYIKFSIHFEGHHLFQTIFGGHQSCLFYPHYHFFSYHPAMIRG